MKRLDSLGLKYLIEKILRKVGELKCECEGGSSTSIDSITEPLIVALFYDGVIAYTTTTGKVLTGLPETIGEAVIKYHDYIRNIGVIGLDKPVIVFTGFSSKEDLEHLALPNTVTTIGAHAVEGSGIKAIEIPDSVQSIAEFAFNGCGNLASVIIGNNVETIGEKAFNNCSALTTITIPASVTSIASDALLGCTFYKSNFINLSALDEVANNYWGATIIKPEEPELEWAPCGETTSYAYNDGTLYVSGDGAMYDYIATTDRPWDGQTITSVVIEEGVTYIGKNAFTGTGITEITIPLGVTILGHSAFKYCALLGTVNLPSSISQIQSSAFQYCNAISTINYEGTLEQWLTIDFDSATSNPANTTGSCLYVDGDHIVDVAIPETITTIHSYSLSGSHMRSIDLHAGVKTIQTLAFGNCKQLQTLISRAVEPPKMSSKNYIDSVTAVYVPAESIDAYNLQTNWASYTAVIQALE